MKPIVGIVGRCGFTNSDEVNNVRIPEKYRTCVINSGGVPIGLMPPQDVEYQDAVPSNIDKLTLEEKEILISQLELCDGIIFPGGLKRFEYDIFILNYALENDIPILGICLGMQIFSMIDEDGNQILNLEEIESGVEHASYDLPLVHEVTISKDSKLYSILEKEKIMVNSRHRMMITNPSTFTVYGRSSDGVIELIERHDKKFAIGVQWHPEMMVKDYPEQKLIFDAFVEACKE